MSSQSNGAAVLVNCVIHLGKNPKHRWSTPDRIPRTWLVPKDLPTSTARLTRPLLTAYSLLTKAEWRAGGASSSVRGCAVSL